MLETLTSGFRSARQRLQGLRTLDEASIDGALREVRSSLLEGDVEFGVVRDFTSRVREKALGETIRLTVNRAGEKLRAEPAEHFIKICYDELEALMGPADSSIRFAPYGVTKVMMVGLQGSGKTTTAAKLAQYAVEQLKKKPILVAVDVYRPAAVDQLKVLGEQIGVPVYAEEDCKRPQEICHRAIQFARANQRDFIIYDTAGRLTLDDQLMRELENIEQACAPENVFLVVDSMIGQDAVRTASEFDRRIRLDGVILTKLDGDARGGAALSIRQVTGKPIKFVGMGEGLGDLDEFRPDGLASRILGFGDIVGLMQDFEQVVDEEKADADAERMLKGKFSLVDFLDQIQMLKKMGSLQDLFDKMPFFPDGLPDGVNVDDGELVKIESMINSMTPTERFKPDLIDASRKKRIARGSGRRERDVDELLTKFRMMRKMMKQLGAGGGSGVFDSMPGLKQLKQMQRLSDTDMDAWFGGGAGSGPASGGPSGRTQARVQISQKRKAAKQKRKSARKSRKKQRRK